MGEAPHAASTVEVMYRQRREQGGSADRCGRSGQAAGRRKFRGPQSAARSSAQSKKLQLMQKQLVLVEYGERWYGAGQRCLMRWAGGDTQRGVETDRGRSGTSSADMGLRCLLEALVLRGSL